MSDDFTRAVIIPACVGLVGGLFLFLGGLALAFVVGAAWWWAAVAAALAAMAFWWQAYLRWTGIAERVLIPDSVTIANDVYTPNEPVHVVISSDCGNHRQFIDLPAQPEQIRALASGLEDGRPFNLGAWAGPGQTFSRSEFEALRAELVRRGLVRPNNPRSPNMGYTLTVAGGHVFKRLALKE